MKDFSLKGKTNVSRLTVSDPHYGADVKCRLSKNLSKKYDWDVEILGTQRTDPIEVIDKTIMYTHTEVAIYVVREEPNLKIEHSLIWDRSHNGFKYVDGDLKELKGEIGVDTARLQLNNAAIFTGGDGHYGNYYIFSNPKEYSNFEKGLVGIVCFLTFDNDSRSEDGFDLTTEIGFKEFFEQIFETSLELQIK